MGINNPRNKQTPFQKDSDQSSRRHDQATGGGLARGAAAAFEFKGTLVSVSLGSSGWGAVSTGAPAVWSLTATVPPSGVRRVFAQFRKPGTSYETQRSVVSIIYDDAD